MKEGGDFGKEDHKELRQLIEQAKANTAQRKAIYDQMEKINNEIQEMESRKTKAEKKVHPKFNQVELIEKGIKEMERKLQVTSTDGKQEKEIIKEMTFMRDSRPYLQEIATLKEAIAGKRQEKNEVGTPLGELKEEGQSVQSRIKELKKAQESTVSDKDNIKKQLDKINADRN